MHIACIAKCCSHNISAAKDHITQLRTWHVSHTMQFGIAVVCSEVTPRWAQLLPGWMTTSLHNQPPRSTHPGHPTAAGAMGISVMVMASQWPCTADTFNSQHPCNGSAA